MRSKKKLFELRFLLKPSIQHLQGLLCREQWKTICLLDNVGSSYYHLWSPMRQIKIRLESKSEHQIFSKCFLTKDQTSVYKNNLKQLINYSINYNNLSLKLIFHSYCCNNVLRAKIVFGGLFFYIPMLVKKVKMGPFWPKNKIGNEK